MKFTLSWLRDHLDTSASPEEIGEALTSLGLEVEKIHNRGKELEPFIIAEIIAAEKHPGADKLQVCKVNNGKEILQIVCGAANARPGIKVVLALSGSIIPANGMQIKAAKIRGAESNGMLCSAAELALADDSEGIIELPDNSPVGEKFAKHSGFDDTLFEIAITPNRGDCLGVRGIARDLAAKGIGKLKPLKITLAKGAFKSPLNVSVENKELCPLFIGRYFRGLKNMESPEWLKKRLTGIGLKPISALVDITNYISYDLGRPSHIYDAKKIKGNIQVREISAPENFRALDDKDYKLTPGTLVIGDNEGTLAIAGVMGGKNSGCTLETSEAFLEVAIFDPAAVAKSGRETMINSDSRYRFERGLDYNFAAEGAEAITALILEICDAEPSGLEITGDEKIRERKILFDPKKVNEVGGVVMERDKITAILESLEFGIIASDDSLDITVPSWRNDVEQSADLVEEVLRVNGYDKILPQAPGINPACPRVLEKLREISSGTRRTLASRGMLEVVSFSFMNSEKAKDFAEISGKMQLLNPISSDLDIMRPSIIPNLLDAAKRNMARGMDDLAFFEIGAQFTESGGSMQQLLAAGLRTGNNHRKNIYGDCRAVDFFDVKADVHAALAEYIGKNSLEIFRESRSYFHPGKSGSFKIGKNTLAVFGELHPAILMKMEISIPVAAFEIFLENIPEVEFPKPEFTISNFQHVDRDFAFILDKNTLAGEIIKTVKSIDKELIEEVRIFDLYKGKGIEDGKKSLAFTVRLQPRDRTLQLAEIDGISTKIIDAVKSKFAGQIRG